MAKDEGDYQPLRTEDDHVDNEAALPPHISHSTRKWLKFHYGFITIAYLLLIALYLTLVRKIYPFSTDSQPLEKINNLFPSLRSAGVLQYEFRTWPVRMTGNPFAGKPRPELDQAWHGLFEKNNIRVTKEDLQFHNITSLPIVGDGRGSESGQEEWVGQLGVFHELHCLKRIRHWIYRDYYLSNAPEPVLIEESAHVDHCIELLREAIICHADTTLSGFRWIRADDGEAHLTVEAPGYHTCVAWETLRAWNDERAVEAFEPGVVAAPDE